MKTMVEIIAEGRVSELVKRLTHSEKKEERFLYEQELNKIKILYEMTPPSFARDILLGTYKALYESYEHIFGEKFEHAFHRRIQEDVRDKQVLTAYKNGRIKLMKGEGEYNARK